MEAHKSAAVGHDNMDSGSKDSVELPQQEFRILETDQVRCDDTRMEAEEDAAAGEDGEVEERTVVKELVVVQ